MGSNEIKRMDIGEFRELGFLQEANRLFFHPHGLALEIAVNEETGDVRLGGVWDCRDDPEGVVFGCAGYGDCKEKAENVARQRSKHYGHRKRMFGVDEFSAHKQLSADIEPLDWQYEESA